TAFQLQGEGQAAARICAGAMRGAPLAGREQARRQAGAAVASQELMTAGGDMALPATQVAESDALSEIRQRRVARELRTGFCVQLGAHIVVGRGATGAEYPFDIPGDQHLATRWQGVVQ